MWIARNKDGELRLFEFPPRRYHEGAELSSSDTGFNDKVSVADGKDIYSFWAIQKYHRSNYLGMDSYGIRIFTKQDEDAYSKYEPECCKNLKWEDEPIEVSITILKKSE